MHGGSLVYSGFFCDMYVIVNDKEGDNVTDLKHQ